MSDMIDLMMKFSTSADVWGEVKLVHVLPQNLFFISDQVNSCSFSLGN